MFKLSLVDSGKKLTFLFLKYFDNLEDVEIPKGGLLQISVIPLISVFLCFVQVYKTELWRMYKASLSD